VGIKATPRKLVTRVQEARLTELHVLRNGKDTKEFKERAVRMKLRLSIGILLAGALAIPVVAQDDHPQPKLPFGSGVITSNPSGNASPELPDGPQDPQLTLKQYEQQMAVITVQTYEELGQIAQAVRAGQMSGEQGWYLAGQRYEVGMIRLQFLDTLHQIIEANIRTGHKSENQEQQTQELHSFQDTVVVPLVTSSPDIPESLARYLELTPVQVAAIQSDVERERKQAQPLLKRLSENRSALTVATRRHRLNGTQIRKLAAEQSHILEQLIVLNSQLQRQVYRILSVEQRRKLDGIKNETAYLPKALFAEW
jgi:hypothetical protein